jgi:uncharacterized membrane protein
MKNSDLILILFLTVICALTYNQTTQLHTILIGVLILLAGYSLKTAVYPLDHGKENFMSALVTTLFMVLVSIVFLRFVGKTYLIPLLFLIVIFCLPVAFLRRRPKQDDEFKIYKTGDKALKKYLETEKARSNKKSLNDEIIIIDRETSKEEGKTSKNKDEKPLEAEKEPLEVKEEPIETKEEPLKAKNNHLVKEPLKVEEPSDEDSTAKYLVCERCGGYYKLKEGESPEDFESCQCGGDLRYETYDEESHEELVQPEINENRDYETEKSENANSTLQKIENAIREADGTVIQKTGNGSIKEIKDPEPVVYRSVKRFVPYDMVFTFIFAGLCLLFLSFPSSNHIGEALGTILMVFFPGYAIATIIYPRKDEINLWERLGLSVMISLLVTLMFAGVSHYKHITSTASIFTIVSIMTMVLAVIAILALLKVTKEESFYGFLAESWKKLKASTWGRGDLSGKMNLILLILLVLSIVTTIYLITNPNPGENFTEFYILGPHGKAADYPTNITAGQNSSVIIGMVNHEHKATNYTMVVQSNGTNMTHQNITLQENQKLEIPYDFILQSYGKREVEFLLYKLPDTQNVYLSLHLWVNVE